MGCVWNGKVRALTGNPENSTHLSALVFFLIPGATAGVTLLSLLFFFFPFKLDYYNFLDFLFY